MTLVSRRRLFAKRLALAVSFVAASTIASHAASAGLTIDLDGPPQPIFIVSASVCGVFTMPDINPRAFRDADGLTKMFALDQDNKPFSGVSLSSVKPTCRSSLSSGENADPAIFDGRRYITSTWTPDGRRVAALVHDEYHAETHPGRCQTADSLSCWFNTVIGARSDDGGTRFVPATPLVVAAAPFRQDVDQTRHRGFFNPSNMFAGPGGVYVFISTTGWTGQKGGACLLRNPDPLDSAGWRGWNGSSFATKWRNPYLLGNGPTGSCEPLAPFGYPVASVVKHRPSGLYLAIWEQPKLEEPTPFGSFPVAGFYLATSRDLIRWSEPTVFLPTAIVHQPCGLRGENRDRAIMAYPSLLDDNAKGRNYDDVGQRAWLYFTQIGMDGCNPGARRILMRRAVTIAVPVAH